MDYRDEVRVDQAGNAVEEKGLGLSSLCARCKHSQIIRRQHQLHVTTYCGELNRIVPSDIVECTAFQDHKRLSLETMKELALPIDLREGISPKAYR